MDDFDAAFLPQRRCLPTAHAEVSTLVFGYLGNPGVGPLHCLRRAIEKGRPTPLQIEEYPHYDMVGRCIAGASKLSVFPLRSSIASDLSDVKKRIRFVESHYDDGMVAVVPPLNPDVTIVHVQSADADGNAQVWGLLGTQKEAAFAARKVIVVAEEIVDERVIRSDPIRTLIPGLIVHAVVQSPSGLVPPISRATATETTSSTRSGTNSRRVGEATRERLRPRPAHAASVAYGASR